MAGKSKGKGQKSSKGKKGTAGKDEIFKEYKFQVYQQAVERVYKDGKISSNEEVVLASMRETLEIPYEIHEKILGILEQKDPGGKPSGKELEVAEKADKPIGKEEFRIAKPAVPLAKKAPKKVQVEEEISKDLEKLSSEIKKGKTSDPGLKRSGEDRYNAYRKALELTLADGEITAKEESILKGLRDTLSISSDEHERIEKETREYIQKENEKKRLEAERTERRKVKEYKNNDDKIIGLEKQVINAKKSGIDIREPQAVIDRARELLDDAKYKEVKGQLAKARNALQHVKKETAANKKIERVEQMLEKAVKMGADTKTVVNMVLQCRDELTKGEFNKADVIITNAKDKLQLMMTGKGSLDQIRKTKELLEKARKHGIEVSGVEAIIEGAKKDFENGNFKVISKKMTQVRKDLREQERLKKSENLIADVQKLITEAETNQIDVGPSKILLKKATDALKANKFAKIPAIIRDIRNDLRDAEEFKETSDQVAEAAALVKEVHKMGAKVTNAEAFLKKAEAELKNKNFYSASRNADLAKQSAMDARENYLTMRAKNAISTINSLINDASDFGADVGESKQALHIAMEMYEKKDYTDLESALKKAEQLAKASLEAAKTKYFTEKITVELASAEDFIRETRKKGVDVSSSEKMLRTIEELLDSGKFDEVENIIREARKITSDSLHDFQLKQANQSISSAESVITEAREAGINVGEAEELLKQAESLFQEEDFEALEKYLEEAQQITKTRWTEHKAQVASEAISSTQSFLAETRELGADVSEAERLLLEAEAQFKDADYDAVEDFVKQAEDLAKSSWDDFRSQLTMDEIKRLEQKLEETEKMGTDVNKAKKQLETAKNYFKDKNFDGAEAILKSARESIEKKFRDAKMKDAKSILENTWQILEESRDLGANLITAEKMYNEAKGMYDADTLDVAVIYEFAKKAEIGVKETREEYLNESTQEAISSAGSLIQELKDTGVDVSEAEDLLMQAESMFKEEDFSSVDEYIKKAESVAQESRINFMTDKLSNDILLTQRFIMDVKDMGGDVALPLEQLEIANKALKENDFDNVEIQIKKTTEIINDIKEKQVVQNSKAKIDDLEKSITDLKKTGLDLTEVEGILNEAKTAFESDDLKEVNQKILKAEELINESRDKYLSTELAGNIDDVQGRIDELKDIGVITDSAETHLTHARESIDNGKFGEAKSFLSQSRQAIDASKNTYFQSEWMNLLSTTQDMINDAKNMGVDTSQTEKKLSEAERLARSGDLIKAKERLTDSENQVKELYETTMVDVAKKSISKVEGFLKETNKLGLDLSTYEAELKVAREAVEKKEYSSVKELTDNINTNLRKERTDLINKKIDEEISPIKSDLEAAREIGAPVRDAEEFIDTATTSFQNGNFPKALKFVERAKNYVIRAKERIVKENHPKVDIEMLTTKFEGNTWNKLKLNLKNSGVIDAKDIRLIFSGDDIEFREPDPIPLLKVGEPKELEVGVKPTASGEIPMEMKLFYYRDFDDNEYTHKDKLDFDVKPQGSYIIEDVFLTYENGLLISHETRKLNEDVQEDVFTSMLSAVQDFVKDSFYSKSKLDLNRLDFGDSKILIEKGSKISLAVVIVGNEPVLLPLFMRECIREIEDTYRDALNDWNGVLEELEGTDEIIKRLLNVSMESEGDIGSLPESYVSTVYNMAKNIKNMGTDPAEMEYLLENAIKSGSEGDFSSAWEYLDQAEEKGKVFMSEAFVESKKVVNNARETGLNVGDIDETLDKAQKHFREGNYEGANNLIDKITTEVKELQEKSRKVMFNEQITIFEESLNEMEGQGADISGPKAYLLMARSAFDEANYDKIENFLSRGQEEFIALKDHHQQGQVTHSIDRAESILSKVRNLDVVDTSKIEEITHMLERARNARDENDFETAVEYSLKARKAADSLIEESSERDSAKDAMEAASTIISASKQAGVDVTSVEDLLNKTQSAYDDGDYLTTQSFAKDIQGMLEKLRKPFQTQITSNTIFSAQSFISEAKEFGAEVKEAEEILKEAKAQFEAEDFEKAEASANNALGSAKIAKRRKQADLLADPLETVRTLINNINSIGADISEAQGYLQEAEDALHKLDIEIATELLKRAENVAQESRDKYLMDIANEAITLTERQIEEAEQIGVDITDAKRMLTQAMEMFEDHEYIKAEQYASNASDLLEEMKEQYSEKQAMDVFEKAGELSVEIKALGADITNAAVHFKLASEAFDKKDFLMLKTHSQNAIDILVEAKKPFMKRICKDAIAFAERQITAAKSFGVDISEAEELVASAKTDCDTKQFDESEEKAKKAAKIAEEAKNLQYENQIRTEINSLRAKVMQYESTGIDTAAVSSHLQKAEIALEGKNYENVGKFLKLTRDWTKKASEQKNKEKVLEVINYSSALINYIKDNIKGIVTEIGPAEKQLQQAKAAFKAKKYTLAEKTANKSKNLVETHKHPKLVQFLFVFKSLQTEEMLNSVRNIISDLKKKSIDTQEIKTFLKKAEFAFENDETFEKGKEYIIEARLKSKDATKRYLSKQASKAISTAQSQIISVKRAGANVREAETLLEKAKISFKAQEFKKSKMMAEKVTLSLKKAK